MQAMASVKKRKNSPYWVACYSLKDGTRKQVSSGTTDKNAALQLALRLEALARDFNRQRAMDLVDEIAYACGERVHDPTPVGVYFQQWRNARQRDWSERSTKSFIAIENSIIAKIGDMKLGHVTKADIASYRDHLQRLGRSRRTVQWHIKYIRRVFASAVEGALIESNPASISCPAPRKSVKQPFSMNQFKGMLNRTSGEWRNLILVAGFTGQRLNDCLALQHEQIEREAGRIRFRRSKNRDYHYVPLHAAISEAIESGFGPVFPYLSSLPATGSRSVSARFREDILPMIGIVQPYGKNMGGNKRVTEYSFHSFRHMLSTELNRIGASPETRMAIVGHSDLAVSKGYTHADFETASKTLMQLTI